jgi:tetratricopeptide (TPR) repeat protein
LKTRKLLFLLIIPLVACTSSKNTSGTRWYHSFNTRYNVYFNGDQSYQEAYKAMMDGYQENYSEMLLFHPVSALPKDKSSTGGPFDKSIEKAVKAIKTHSIQTKPERKAGKQNDPAYREFMSHKEYNPFLHNAWMMMARSQFFNGDFLEASSSFSYISRLYETQPEISTPALIWKARAYAEMDWLYEAEDILVKLGKQELTKSEKDLYSGVYADLMLKRKDYENAIPYMQVAIKSEKNRLQKWREQYILGQMQTTVGQKDEAYKTFKKVSGSSAPYPLTLNAKIRETEVFPGGDTNKMAKSLKKMLKSSKNEEYLDLIYYALGNVYMSIPDTTKAVESYELGVEKSVKNGIEKALNEIQLGDIYFTTRKYLKAQPNYSDALGQLKKEDEAYPRVSKRSEVLDQLVVHYEAVELQDSLQRLAKMTKEEQLAVVNKIIADLIKKEKEEQEKAEMAEYKSQQDERLSQQQQAMNRQPVIQQPATGTDSESFYFYNQQAVALGKTAFQQKWGRRKLEDDWRRRDKASPMSDGSSDEVSDTETDTDTADVSTNESDTTGIDKNLSTDPKDPMFYLQQIPVTEEDIEASNLILQDGLFNMAVIYKDLLEDNSLALETFDRLNTQFPENENKLEAYHHIYMIYLREDSVDMYTLYKAKIREEFPESALAAAMADPDYEYNLKMMNFVQDSLYRTAYYSYLDGQTPEVRKVYGEVSQKYSQSPLMPKFMFVNALTFVTTNETDTFKVLLRQLVDKYPEADVSLLADDILKGFQRGLKLSASGDNMLARGSLFNMRFGGAEADSLTLDSTVVFRAENEIPHELILIYPRGSINDNLLLYNVAGFNFGNFRVNDFDLEKQDVGNLGLLHVKGFKNYDEVMQYVSMISSDSGYVRTLGKDVIVAPISVENFNVLMKGRSLDEYFAFFAKNYSTGNETLIARWNLQKQEEEAANIEEEKQKAEEAEKAKIDAENTETQEITIPTDSISTNVLPSDTIPLSKPDENQAIDAVSDVYNEATERVEELTEKWNEIASDPIRGILNLFKRKPKNAIDDYAKQQEEAEKERQKTLKKAQQERDKIVRDSIAAAEKEQKAALRLKENEEKAQKEAEEKAKKEALKKQENDKKLKEAEEKRLKQEKDDAKKAAQKQREADKKAKEKLRKETMKQKEQERKEKEKLRREEQKAREQARKDAQKQKEAERKNKK